MRATVMYAAGDGRVREVADAAIEKPDLLLFPGVMRGVVGRGRRG